MTATTTPNEAETHADGSPKPRTGTEDWKQYSQHRGRIIYREPVAASTHVLIVEKPDGFDYQAGQGVELSIDREGHREQKHPMFLTSLPGEPRLEMLVHVGEGESDQNSVIANDCPIGTRLLFDDAQDMLHYTGPGVFIAGGAGVAAFLGTFRHLAKTDELDGNRLFLVNNRKDEVVMQSELFRRFGHSVTSTLLEEEDRDHEYGPVDREWLEKRVGQFDQPFYLCGPPEMVETLESTVRDLGGEVQTVPWPGSIG